MIRKQFFVGAAVVAVLAACLWGGSFLYLKAFASEGSLPPRSKLPQVPAGATLVGEETSCGSGGCWRTMNVRPAAGQTPEELAAQMGLTQEKTESSVHLSAEARGDELVIHIGYQ